MRILARIALALALTLGFALPAEGQSGSKIVFDAVATGQTGAMQTGPRASAVSFTFCGTGFSGDLYVDAAATSVALAQVWTTTLAGNSDCTTTYAYSPASKWYRVRWTRTAGTLNIWMAISQGDVTPGMLTGPVGGLTAGRVVLSSGATGVTDDAGLTYNAGTDALTVGGAVSAASAALTGGVTANTVTVSGLPSPGSITVTPVLSYVGSITTVAGSLISDGEYFTIDYGGGVLPIEFDLSPGDGTTGGRIPLIYTGLETAAGIKNLIIPLVNAAAPTQLTASDGGAAVVALVLDTPGATGGTNTENVGNIGFSVTGFEKPTAATTYTYKLVARLADGTTTEAGAASTTAAGHATLSAANYNAISWSAVTGATSYDVYRTVGGATQGKIASATTALALDDTGLAGGGEKAPTVDGTGRVTADGITVATGASAGYVWTSDANGVGSWAAASGGISGLTAGRVTLSTGATSVGDDAGLLFDSTNNRLSVVGGVVGTGGSEPAVSVTATLPASPSAAVDGIKATVTGAGSASYAQRGLYVELAAGYTGTTEHGAVYGIAGGSGGLNTSAGMRVGVKGAVSSSGGTGWSAGVLGENTAGVSVGNFGVMGKATGSLYAIGTAGIAPSGGGTARVGGWFGFAEPATWTSTALLADNGSVAAPIALFRDNGTTKVSIEDGGLLKFASPGTIGSITKTLTDATPTNFATIALADGETTAGEILYRVVVTDGTSRQVLKGRFRYSGTRVSTDYDADTNEVGTQLLSQKPDGGTLTCTLAGAAAGGVLTFSADCNSSLTTPVLTLHYRFDTTNAAAVITPL